MNSRNPTSVTASHIPTIGVFDSGFGGLTILRALLDLIPDARYIYLGDTARLPYGSKSRETVVRYAVSSARFLAGQGADLLVIACNTASALALEEIRDALPIPVIGVIEPGAQAALAAASSSNNHVLVLATDATVQSHVYAQTLQALNLEATEKACPLLVPLVEEGWLHAPAKLAVTSEAVRIYLSEAFTESPGAKTLLLGCTHYPLLQPIIEQTLATLGHPMHVIDSARATALATQRVLLDQSFITDSSALTAPAPVFYATDSIEKFQRLGSQFLGRPLQQVHLLNLGG